MQATCRWLQRNCFTAPPSPLAAARASDSRRLAVDLVPLGPVFLGYCPGVTAENPGLPEGLTRSLYHDVGRRRAGTNDLVVDDEADHHVHMIPGG
jgi:hypothetical protein